MINCWKVNGGVKVVLKGHHFVQMFPQEISVNHHAIKRSNPKFKVNISNFMLYLVQECTIQPSKNEE